MAGLGGNQVPSVSGTVDAGRRAVELAFGFPTIAFDGRRYGPLPRSVGEAKCLVALAAASEPADRTSDTSFDFRVLDGHFAFRCAVSDGDVIVEIGVTFHLPARRQGDSQLRSGQPVLLVRRELRRVPPCGRRSASGCAEPAGARRPASRCRGGEGSGRSITVNVVPRPFRLCTVTRPP